jgi:hypothetical protein
MQIKLKYNLLRIENYGLACHNICRFLALNDGSAFDHIMLNRVQLEICGNRTHNLSSDINCLQWVVFYKVNYVKQHHYGGVMVWALDNLYHYSSCEFDSRKSQAVLDSTLCDTFCQLLTIDWWFSLDIAILSIAEILKVRLLTSNPLNI